ncbi:MAG TPA: folate family ECF transporter S component [Thermoanaerobacterales bacterium]|nr:folate family ECF transporter S component [Thermoanaerobacterales bacterium]
MKHDNVLGENSHKYGSRLSTRELVMASFLSAFSIILTRYVSIMIAGGSIRLGFGNLPVITSGILLGPLLGGLTGLISDVVGVIILPQGTFHPGFTLSGILTGVIPGLIMRVNWRNRFSLFNIILANLSVYILISLCLNTFWLTHLLGKGFLVLLPERAISSGIVTAINTVVIYSLSKFFRFWY